MAREIIAAVFVLAGLLFFLGGTLGVLRFPDVYTRLHALTKADNVGLGLVCVGLAVRSESALVAVKLFVVWGLVMIASAAACHLIARTALREGIEPWKER